MWSYEYINQESNKKHKDPITVSFFLEFMLSFLFFIFRLNKQIYHQYINKVVNILSKFIELQI